MTKINVLHEYCKSCGICVDICPKSVLKIGDKANKKGYFSVVCTDQEKCISCTLCATMCPDVAIEVFRARR